MRQRGSSSSNLEINMGVIAKLNTLFGGDASGINKASKEAKQAVRDFSKTTDSAMSALGDVLGVNSQKIEQLGSAAKGLGIKLSQSGNSGVAAFGNLLGSVNKLSLGIAGLGIGAAIAAFKQLGSLAETFKSTVEGTNMELQSQAYLRTYQAALNDVNKETGRAALKFVQSWKEGVAQVKGVAKQMFINNFTSTSGALTGFGDVGAWKETIGQAKEANRLGQEAKRIAGEIYDLERQRSNSAREWASMEAEAVSLRNQSLDKTKSQEERAAALARAEELIRQKYTEQYDIESRIAELMDEQNRLTESTPAEIDAANQQWAKANGLMREMEQSLSRILSKQQSLTSNSKQLSPAVAKQLDQIIQGTADSNIGLADRISEMLSWNGAVSSPITGKAAVQIPVELKVPESNFSDVVVDLQGSISDLAATAASSLGQLAGDLMTGGDAWGNFADSAISALADVAISVGKIAIATGVAAKGIKEAIKLNPVAAIAGGAALVALGMAAKASLANVASGSYSASSSVADSGFSGSTLSSSAAYGEREFNVSVTGTLKASGNQLVAVLNNEAKRTKATT